MTWTLIISYCIGSVLSTASFSPFGSLEQCNGYEEYYSMGNAPVELRGPVVRISGWSCNSPDAGVAYGFQGC